MQAEQPPFQPSLLIKLFIGYIYFMQGVYLSLIGSVPYLYQVFPSPEVLSLFSIVALPFSFKYISAPFVQKITLVSYGRRKSWIVLSLFASALLTYPLGTIIDKVQRVEDTVRLLFLIFVFVSMGDICVDAAAVKELNDPVLAGYLQASMQPAGLILGGFLIVKIVNPTFWTFLGIKGPLCSLTTFFGLIAIIGIVIAVIAHFCYQERGTQSGQIQQIADLRTIVRYYRHFVMPKYQLCRIVIYFLTIYQGLKMFKICYGNEAIYRGFSKERAAQIGSLSTIIAIVANTIMAKFVNKQNTWTYLLRFYYLQLAIYIPIFLYDDMNAPMVIATSLIVNTLSNMRFLLHSSLINLFGDGKFSGLCITTLASFVNFGNNSWLQLQVTGIFGYWNGVGMGLIVAALTGLLFPWMIGWIKRGQPETHYQSPHEKKD